MAFFFWYWLTALLLFGLYLWLGPKKECLTAKRVCIAIGCSVFWMAVGVVGLFLLGVLIVEIYNELR